MSREAVRRLFSPSICASCRTKIIRPSFLVRPFTTTPTRFADDPTPPPPARSGLGSLASLSASFASSQKERGHNSAPSDWLNAGLDEEISKLYTDQYSLQQQLVEPPPHHLHIYCTKHNTHITLTKPNYDAIMSVSAGNIGFRKAGRGSYDAAYQLAAYVLSRIQDQGLLREILRLEIVLRGFGQGREAVTKAILGSEGRNIRNKVIKVTDATRLKFGGARSPKPRRLG